MGVADYSATPASNAAINGVNIAEGCAPGNVNDAIRQLMADIAAAEAPGGVAGRWYGIAASGAAVSHTGDTAETALATVTIPAAVLGANGLVRVHALWGCSSSGNNKTFRARWSTISGTIFRTRTQTTDILTSEHLLIQNRNATNSQVATASDANQAGWADSTGSPVTAAIDTTAATTLLLTGQLADAGDSITLQAYLVEVMKRA